jgi:hypothetical protein
MKVLLKVVIEMKEALIYIYVHLDADDYVKHLYHFLKSEDKMVEQ